MTDVSEVNLTCIYCIYFSISRGTLVLHSSNEFSGILGRCFEHESHNISMKSYCIWTGCLSVLGKDSVIL